MSGAEYSSEFAEIARVEAERLRVRAVEVRVRSDRWAERARWLAAEAEQLEARLRDLDEMLGRAPQLRLDLQTQELKGQRLRDEAVRVLVERHGMRLPIHYREWYALLRAEGLVATGKDPLATFLTQITRSPLVERVEGRSGIYQVNAAAAYARARAELAAAGRALAAAEDKAAAGDRTAVVTLRALQARFAAAQQLLDATLSARSVVVRERLSAA